MKSPSLAFFLGLILGGSAVGFSVYLWKCEKAKAPAVVAAPTPPPAHRQHHDIDPWEPLVKVSGEWASADGRQVAKFDSRILSFPAAKSWPDLEGESFLLGREEQFMSESGIYTIFRLDSEPDTISMIKEDRATKELTSFNLYRAGSPLARSREPLPETPPPPHIQAVLDAIPTITRGDSVETVKRKCLKGIRNIEVLSGESGLGEGHEYWRLGQSEEWVLHLSYDSSGVYRFRIIRGNGSDFRKGLWDASEYCYPAFLNGQLIEGVSGTGLQRVAPARE